MRLRFPDRAIRRLYEAKHPFPAMRPEVVQRFFEVAAVLTQASLISDFAGLKAFAASPVDGHAGRWSIPVGPDWKLFLTITNDSPPVASLDELRRSAAPWRST